MKLVGISPKRIGIEIQEYLYLLVLAAQGMGE